MNGRRYRLCSPSAWGTQSRFSWTTLVTDSMKSSVGNAGICMRAAECAKRAAFFSGRNIQTESSAWR